MEMFTSLAACKCVQRMYQNFSLGVFNSLQGNENQMISFFFFFQSFFFFFLSVIMQLNNDECSRGKGERERKGERVSYQQIWKTNFTMEAKTQKGRVEGGCGLKASPGGDQSLLGKMMVNDYYSAVVQWCL